ncbi:MAG: hypothetical protein GF401_10260 [Chitinivibrionales bacterium]|nr:hypothetical protein [Chitinivibrionales bacterium]
MRKYIVSIFAFALLMTFQSQAVRPYFNSYGWFQLLSEGEIAISTRYASVTSGVETWYNKWRGHIEYYVNTGPWYGAVYMYGQWQYRYIDADIIASLIRADNTLGLQDIPQEVVDYVESKLEYDRNRMVNHPNDYYNSYWYPWESDPITQLKWRSVYMEGRYAENDFTTCTDIHANCWGTADYLAMDYEWAEKYEYDFPGGAPSDRYRFPHIYVDGGKYYLYYGQYYYNEYCIDDDLDPDVGDGNQRAVFKGHRTGAAPSPQPENLLNSFDVIRLAEDPIVQNDPEPHEMGIGSSGSEINVGKNLHCVAYLCTDEYNYAWVYEKHNYGCTKEKPYGINVLGYDLWGPPVIGIGAYDDKYCSFFKKYGYNKDNMPDSYDMNWAGITE